MMKGLVTIPTYNERENIAPLIEAIFKEVPHIHILVIDDNSPDGTSQVVTQIAEKNPQVHLLLRQKKEGLGRAYIAGFKWGLERKYEFIVEMDADFSHRPADLRKLVEAIPHYDFCVGSRYVPGGSTANWGIGRKIISKGGSFYSRVILGYPLRDWTGGFNAWKARVLETIGLDQVTSNGYSFQIELKYKALKNNFIGQEVPILFEDRRVGHSKMSYKIVLEAFYRVWQIRFR